MSSGTAIVTGNNFPPPLGVPTVTAPTCAPTSGGTLANGSVWYVYIRTANNLNTHGGSTAIAGPSMHTAEFTVTCSGAASAILVTSPSAVGNSPFQAKDYQVAVTATGPAANAEQIQINATTGGTMTCTAGVVSTFNGNNFGCLMGSSATIKSVATATRNFEDTDLSNVAIVIGSGQTVSFTIQMTGITLECGPIGSTANFNMPNWMIWNQSGEELTGVSWKGMNIAGGCGGYHAGVAGVTTGGSSTTFSCGYIYDDTKTPKSSLEHISLAGGNSCATVNAPFYDVFFDGRFDSTGGAAGGPRRVTDVTTNPKTGNSGINTFQNGNSTDACSGAAYSPANFYATGARARLHFYDIHMETTLPSTADGLQYATTVPIAISKTPKARFQMQDRWCMQQQQPAPSSGKRFVLDRQCDQRHRSLRVPLGQSGSEITGSGGFTFKDDSNVGNSLIGYIQGYGTGVTNSRVFREAPLTFAALNALYNCATPPTGKNFEGMSGSVTDSSTNVAGGTISGGGSNHVWAYCNGTNWIVASGLGSGGGTGTITSITFSAPFSSTATPCVTTCTVTGPTLVTSAAALALNFPMAGASGQQSKTISLAPTVLSDAASVTWSINSSYAANASLSLAHTLATRQLNIGSPLTGGTYVIRLVQDATGGAAITLGTGCAWKVIGSGSGAITLTSTANAIDILTFYYDGTNCYANLGPNYN